ncbi:Transposon Ty3-I Gag-Pol polyprotein [Senna tora]|uniref:Transposon Ty3-I Gag-Pol polyprotein n=1 Tax=Senna tora TaxID=362788 RepID=A0A834WFX5_9FABA|nr:Transposon Ty3-I Gag-Pol polyprotein [Senna tora]
MADNTRAKELATKFEKLQEAMAERDVQYAVRFELVEKAVGSFDRLEKTVESIARAVDTLAISRERPKMLPDTDKADQEQQGVIVPQPYQPFHTRSVKLDFPRFNGSEPLHWLFKAEKFFAYYETPDDQRVTIAAVHFEGVVVPWFQMMSKSSRVDSWVTLSKAIEVEFGPSQFESPRALLFKLFQRTSMADFYREFMILATRVEGISDEALLDCFISGLKPGVRRDVIAQAPSSLLRAAALARLFDERSSTKFASSSVRGSFTSSTSLVHVPSSQVTAPLSSSTSLVPLLPSSASLSSTTPGKSSLPPLLPTPNVQPLRSVKRMSAAEMQLRREKKLCFTHDAPYSWSHKCPNKQYMILQIEDEDDGDPPSLELPSDISPSSPAPPDPPSHHLSLNALSGEHAVGTIRFTGVIQGVEVQILLDGGSSDTFIQPRVVRNLKLAVEPVTPFKVLFITLHGEPKTIAKMAQFNHLRRLTNMDAISEYFAIQPQHMDTGAAREPLFEQLPEDLQQLLQTFSVVFNVPHGLPPPRSHDHQIPLQDDRPVRAAITSAPVLVLPNFSKPFTIETVASGVGIGAVLSQEGRPITFFSKKMSSQMQHRSAYAHEMYAITEAVAKFRHYLIGHFFTIRTDKKSLRHLTDQTLQTPEQEEWLPKLLGFQFSIE